MPGKLQDLLCELRLCNMSAGWRG
ncbi:MULTISPECIES: RepA leader peptide Tap [Lelliottia]